MPFGTKTPDRKPQGQHNKARSIRIYCLDVCCCGQQVEVRECMHGWMDENGKIDPDNLCPLWYYRMGRRLTEEEMSVLDERKGQK